MTLPHITNKQKEILTLFPKYRFLNRKHIQHFLNHKDKKTIQIWLNDLLQKDYIQKIENRHQFPQQASTYCIAKNGIKFLKEQENFSDSFLTNLYREDERSNTYISRSFFLADICLELSKASNDKEVFQYSTRSDYVLPESQFHFLKDLHPSLCFTKKVKGKKAVWYLLEVFSSTFPSQVIRRRIHSYARFLAEEQWSDTPGNTAPVIFFIVPSKEILMYAKQYTKKKLKRYEIEDADISFALLEDVQKEGIRGEIWKEIY